MDYLCVCLASVRKRGTSPTATPWAFGREADFIVSVVVTMACDLVSTFDPVDDHSVNALSTAVRPILGVTGDRILYVIGDESDQIRMERKLRGQ